MIPTETISHLSIAPVAQQVPVKQLLSPEDKQLLDLLAEIFTDHLIKQINYDDGSPV